jgi:hypothetical protein
VKIEPWLCRLPGKSCLSVFIGLLERKLLLPRGLGTALVYFFKILSTEKPWHLKAFVSVQDPADRRP